jgi:glycosyltransferase involved in cell wall biosynthesis
MMSIAAVVITKDEERNIGPCLESLRWTDEIIVVDACSGDRTVEIARQYTDRLFVRAWPGFGPQKNFGIDKTNADWVLVVDADERVTEPLQKEILALLRTGPPADVAGFEIPRRNYFYGKWIRGGGIYPDYQLRLFRRSAGRYDDVLLHERLSRSRASGAALVVVTPSRNVATTAFESSSRLTSAPTHAAASASTMSSTLNV